MAQLWGGRFTKETDRLAYQFNASINFDKRFFAQDIEGSIAHAAMLKEQGILTVEGKETLPAGMAGICRYMEEGRFVSTEEYEDFLSFVDANRIDRIGHALMMFHT